MTIENPTNLTDIISYQAEKQPDAIAVYTAQETISYQQLDFLVWKVATYLIRQGVSTGDTAVLIFRDELSSLVAILAVARIGATVFSILENTPKLLYEEMIEAVNAKVLITDYMGRKEKKLPVLFTNLNTIKKDDELVDLSVRCESPEAPWVVITGSGSTGKSKFLPVSHAEQIERMKISLKWLALTPEDRIASLVHIDYYASKMFYLEAFIAGASTIQFNGNTDLICMCKKFKITIMHMTAMHIQKLIKSLPENATNSILAIKTFLIGGSPVSDDLRKQIFHTFDSDLFVRYGINEVGTVSVSKPSEVYQSSGTVGFPLKIIDVEIVDRDDQALDSGNVGLIRIKSPTTINGYLNDEEATRKAFKDGWFYPGDLGKMTEDGQLIHLGRADHMMIMNGINIYPEEIEQTIASHPEVEDAAAMPIKSSVHQDIPVCAVVLSSGSTLTEKDLLEYAFQRLGARGPKRVIRRDTIPRNEQGKLIRQELSDAINLQLRTSRRSDTAAKKENFSQYTQAMQTFTSRLNRGDLPVRLGRIDAWLTSVLQIDIEPLPKTAFKAKDHVLECMWRILLLSGTLLQSIRVPLFDPGEIRNINESSPEHYVITVGMVQIEYIPKKVFIRSLQTASNIILNFMKRPVTPENRQILFASLQKEFISPLNRISGSGKSTMPILREAHRRGIPFRHLKNGVYQLGWGSKSRRMNRSSTDSDSIIGGVMSHNKIVTAALLYDAGLPAPVHKVAVNEEEALLTAKALGWPIVVKPSDGDRGEGVTVDVVNDATLIEAFTLAREASKSKRILIEQQVDGVCCRIFIAGQKMLYAVMRLPKSVRGNGVSSIRELIDEANRIEIEMPPWKKSESFPLDEMALEVMGADGFTPESVPKQEQLVPLRRIESTQWGGVDEDVSGTIHPDNIDLALRAAKLFGLHVAGIDIITADITVPWYENAAIINEVNLSPLFGGGEISQRAIPSFLDDFIEGDGCIPITLLTGGAEAMERALALQKEQIDNGIRCFVTSHAKSIDWMGKEVHFASRNLYDRCQALLMDARVGALVLVTP